ncbi:hypothetical protein L1887_05572 [Cichorium endivia]|nr:hypothetical protein L1887_05572 [Cichorium endivia]
MLYVITKEESYPVLTYYDEYVMQGDEFRTGQEYFYELMAPQKKKNGGFVLKESDVKSSCNNLTGQQHYGCIVSFPKSVAYVTLTNFITEFSLNCSKINRINQENLYKSNNLLLCRKIMNSARSYNNLE